MKKGFALIDALYSIVITGLVAYFAIQFAVAKKYETTIADDVAMTKQIIDAGVMNAQTGYGKGTGGYCSANVGLYEDVSAVRIFKCAEMLPQSVFLNATAATTDATERDGTKSFFRLMRDYSNTSEEGCKIYFLETTEMDKFKIFVNCSTLQDSKQKSRLESEMTVMLTSSFAFAVSDIKNQALNFTTDIGGTTEDGLIAFTLRN